MKRPFNQHVPPPHPNWTGRSFRTSQEAYGGQLHFEGNTRTTITRWEVLIYVLCLLAVALLAAAFLTGEPK